MEKIINVVLKDNKNIVISVDGTTVTTITETSRTISAKDIFDIIDSQDGVVLRMGKLERNEKFDKLNDVLKYFHKLIEDIIVSLYPVEEVKDVKKEA